MSNQSNTSLFYKWNALPAQRKGRILLGTALGGAVLAALAALFAFLRDYEADIGYFVRGSVLSVLLIAVLGLAALWALAVWALQKKEKLPAQISSAGNGCYFVTVFAAFMSVFEGIFRVVMVVRKNNLFQQKNERIEKISAAMDLICILLAFATAVFFFCAANEKPGKKRYALLGLLPAFKGMCGILQIFFDVSIAMNSPVKLLGEAGLMAVTLYYLAEDRFRVGGDYIRTAAYCAASVFVLIFSAATGGALVFFYFIYNSSFAGTSGAAQYGEICLQAVYCLITFAYALVQFLSYVRSFGQESLVKTAEVPAETEAAVQTAESGTEPTAEPSAQENAAEEEKNDEE